jgi:hypothetical protein
MEGNNGSEVVEYRRAQYQPQLNFVETTPRGNMTLTTVFAPPQLGEPMPSVHSRHIWITPGNIAVSQYAGKCVSTE